MIIIIHRHLILTEHSGHITIVLIGNISFLDIVCKKLATLRLDPMQTYSLLFSFKQYKTKHLEIP